MKGLVSPEEAIRPFIALPPWVFGKADDQMLPENEARSTSFVFYRGEIAPESFPGPRSANVLPCCPESAVAPEPCPGKQNFYLHLAESNPKSNLFIAERHALLFIGFDNNMHLGRYPSISQAYLQSDQFFH